MKKKKTKARVSHKNITPDLPQNIIPVGERVFDDKNIYIHQKVYAQIHKFAANKTENEHGGILVGRVINEMGKENTIVEGFIEAKYNEATPTTLTFTHETWDYFHSEMDRKYKDKKIVGWIHTHPNFGIFLSENDRFIQQNFFTDVNQVAYVVDPIQSDEGFFFWVNEKLERCPGFYMFDKNGVKIKQKPWNVDIENDAENDYPNGKNKEFIFSTILVILLIVNIIITIFQTSKIKTLEQRVEDQNTVIQYGMYGAMGAPDVSVIADNIKEQIKAYEKAQKKSLEDALEDHKDEGTKTATNSEKESAAEPKTSTDEKQKKDEIQANQTDEKSANKEE